jgi:hypothetical protein
MSNWLRPVILLLGLGAGAALLFAPIFPVESGVSGALHLDLEEGVPTDPGVFGTTAGPAIPPDCSTWHEIYPNNCAPHHQDGYGDSDGDGMISPCDYITLNGKRYHITWVGPTYWVTCYPPFGGPPVSGFAAEPTQTDPTSESPVCEVWHWIWPPTRYCQESHIDSWEDDNGDQKFNECDRVNIFELGPGYPPTYYHIDRIGTDIIVDPGTQAKESTWGFLKDLFR